MGKYLPQKGNVREKKKKKLVPYGTLYFRGPSPFIGKFFPILIEFAFIYRLHRLSVWATPPGG